MYKLFTFSLDADALCPPSRPRGSSATNTETLRPVATDKPLVGIRNTALSQQSLVAKYMALDPVALDAFEERAAILQFDAGLSREDAERQAFIQVMEAFRQH